MFDRALNLPLQSPCLIHLSNKIYVKDEHINDSESEKRDVSGLVVRDLSKHPPPHFVEKS